MCDKLSKEDCQALAGEHFDEAMFNAACDANGFVTRTQFAAAAEQIEKRQAVAAEEERVAREAMAAAALDGGKARAAYEAALGRAASAEEYEAALDATAAALRKQQSKRDAQAVALEALLEEAVRVKTQAHGAGHPRVAAALHALACALFARGKRLKGKGRLAEATPLYRASLSAETRAKGEGHLHVAVRSPS